MRCVSVSVNNLRERFCFGLVQISVYAEVSSPSDPKGIFILWGLNFRDKTPKVEEKPFGSAFYLSIHPTNYIP